MSYASSVMLLISNCLLHILKHKTLKQKDWSLVPIHFTKCTAFSMCSMLTAVETVHDTLIIQITESLVENNFYILLGK